MLGEEYITRAEHDEFVKRLDAQDKRQDRRIELLEETTRRIGDMNATLVKLTSSVENMANELKNQGTRLATIEKKPGDNWNFLVKQAAIVIIAALVGAALSQIGIR